jgi:hypothetical protein
MASVHILWLYVSASLHGCTSPPSVAEVIRPPNAVQAGSRDFLNASGVRQLRSRPHDANAETGWDIVEHLAWHAYVILANRVPMEGRVARTIAS